MMSLTQTASYLIFILIALSVSIVQCKSTLPWWQIKLAKSQGPNACIVEEVPDLNRKYWTECKFWPVRKVCGKETLIRYECCEGFQQIPGEGCRGVKPLKNVLSTARDLGATKFVNYLEESGLSRELSEQGTFTLFAPLDSAFESTIGGIIKMKIESFIHSKRNPVLSYHISIRKVSSKEFSGNLEISSLYENRTLRINKYSNGMETVNCALIVRKDQEATNGVVHIIDNLLDPTLFMPSRDVAQIVAEDGRFSRMANAIERCGFTHRLAESGKSYTCLAPSDEAFLKIPPSRLEIMLADRDSCLAMLENHIIPHVMCQPVITEEYSARTIGYGNINFNCDEKGTSVQKVRLQSDFLLGSNGIVYMLEEVLIPDRAKSLLELCEAHGLAGFAQLIKIAGLEDTFNNYRDYTLFAPSEAAFYSALNEEVLENAHKNPELAKKIVLFHAIYGRIRTEEIQQNQVRMSLDEENPLRFSIYRKKYGVEDATIQKGNIEGMNGILHICNKVLFPARESAGDLLRKSGNFTIFLEEMEKYLATDAFAVNLRQSQDSSHYTFFVPSDSAFKSLGHDKLNKLLDNSDQMRRVLKNHISSSLYSYQSFTETYVYELQTQQNSLGVMCKNGKMIVNDATVIQKDLMSSSGIIHIMDKLLLPEEYKK